MNISDLLQPHMQLLIFLGCYPVPLPLLWLLAAGGVLVVLRLLIRAIERSAR